MIKPEELRIGNWVKWPDEKEPNEVPWAHGHWLGVFEKNYSLPEPIPITDEWLIRFGFVKHDQGLFENIQMSYWAKDAVLLFFNGSPPENTYLLGFGFNDINQKYYAATMCWINSVHELQNAYHSMKQKDITISEPTKQ